MHTEFVKQTILLQKVCQLFSRYFVAFLQQNHKVLPYNPSTCHVSKKMALFTLEGNTVNTCIAEYIPALHVLLFICCVSPLARFVRRTQPANAVVLLLRNLVPRDDAQIWRIVVAG